MYRKSKYKRAISELSKNGFTVSFNRKNKSYILERNGKTVIKTDEQMQTYENELQASIPNLNRVK